ncbi:MAG: spermidine synthase [bacterium]|nr:MAG: spermidine synthase [bacterium]
MSSQFEELDYQETPLGELSLRRRRSPAVPGELVYEVKIGNDLLMSSTVNASERALSTLVLDALSGRSCDVLVGGLGLGYTAATALEYANVRRLVVIEFLPPVIEWHRRHLVPLGEKLTTDPRCRLVHGDFFERMGEASPRTDADIHDVILLDIDHSPDSLLHERHQFFYTEPGLRRLRNHLRPDGLFGLWSAAEPTDEFLGRLRRVFASVQSHVIEFTNPHLGVTDTNWVVVGGVA